MKKKNVRIEQRAFKSSTLPGKGVAVIQSPELKSPTDVINIINYYYTFVCEFSISKFSMSGHTLSGRFMLWVGMPSIPLSHRPRYIDCAHPRGMMLIKTF